MTKYTHKPTGRRIALLATLETYNCQMVYCSFCDDLTKGAWLNRKDLTA